MNTPTHLILSAAVFAKPNQRMVTAAALLGGFLPDFSLYFMYFWHKFVLKTSDAVIFGEIYYTPFWQLIFAIDNSFFVWGLLLVVAWLSRSAVFFAFSGSGFLHILFDFPFHNDDARAHFWPVSPWKFESPVSYWDPAHYGGVMQIVEFVFVIMLLSVLWHRFPGRKTRYFLILLGLTPLVPLVAFNLMFAGG